MNWHDRLGLFLFIITTTALATTVSVSTALAFPTLPDIFWWILKT